MELIGFRIRKGSVTGHKHTRKGINNQDAHFMDKAIIDNVPYVFGAVADGCSLSGQKVLRGQSVRTEVGAVLLTSFIKSEIPLLLASHTPMNLFAQSLYHRCVSYLANVARTTVVGGPDVQWDFIERNLLATVIGFVMNEQVLVTFMAGDGMTIVNDEVNAIDQDNKPRYLAYHLVDRTILGSAADELPQCFDWAPYQMADVKRFAICTDGIVDAWKSNPSTIDGIWKYQPQASAGLQWWLNHGSNTRLFGDDCTIIGAERLPQEVAAEIQTSREEDHEGTS